MKKFATILSLCLLPAAAWADCWQQAGARYDIDPLLLAAIAEQESGFRTNAMNRNKDGSYDIGLMQINSRHLPRLAKQGIDQQKLLNNVCVSVMVAASILSDFSQRLGGTWEAVGAYNAGVAARSYSTRLKYSKSVWTRYQRMLKRRPDLRAAIPGHKES